jgi:hypothetical protein
MGGGSRQEKFPADATLMEYWLAGLTNVPTEIVKTVVTDFSPYGLNHPALQYTVRFGPEAGAQAEARIEFGTNQAGNVFERRLGEDPVNTISPGDFDRLPRVSWQLRDRQVWNFAASNVVSVTVHQLGGTLAYLRDPDGNWTYAPGFNSQVPSIRPPGGMRVPRGAIARHLLGRRGRPTLDRFGFAKTSHEVEFSQTRRDQRNLSHPVWRSARPSFIPTLRSCGTGNASIFEFPADLYEEFGGTQPYSFTARYILAESWVHSSNASRCAIF